MPVRQSTLHVPRPLETLVLAYTPDQDQYLFQAAAPKLPVRHKADTIRKESKGALLQNYDLSIGPNGQFPQVSLVMDASQSYLTQPYGIEVPLIDDERANADSEIAYDQRQVKFGLIALMTRFEYISIKVKLRTAASYGSNVIALGPPAGSGFGPRQWSNYQSLKSDPYADHLFVCGAIENKTTKRPNFIGYHSRTWDTIINHPRVKARAERELGGGAYMTVELWEKILRLSPGTIHLTSAMYNVSKSGEDYRSFIGPDAIFAYNEPQNLSNQGFAQTFWFTGMENSSGMKDYSVTGQEDLTPAGDIVVRSYPAPWVGKGATMVKMFGEWDFRILNSSAGFLLQNVVDPTDPMYLGDLSLFN